MNNITLNGINETYNNIYYISVDGSDSTGYGTKEHPFATYDKAFSIAISGDLIYFKKGTYLIDTVINKAQAIQGFICDGGKQLIIYAERFSYFVIKDPISPSNGEIHGINIYNANTKVIGFVIDWDVTNRSAAYQRSIFGHYGGEKGYIYNCHFIIRSATAFCRDGTLGGTFCISCQFDIRTTPEQAYKYAVGAKFINCSMNLDTWEHKWGISEDSDILSSVSYDTEYQIVPPNDIYGIYNAYYKWHLDRYLVKQNDKYYSIKDNILTELGIPTDDTEKEQWFNDYGVSDLKEALLTPDEGGNKLIDSLDDKFEVRMMVPKD